MTNRDRAAPPQWPYKAPPIDPEAPPRPVKTVTFAVVIAAYNVGRFIGEAIESVLSQTRRPDQVIVVDDGSSDETPTKLADYGDQITVISQPNRGEGAAKNAGWRAAQTDFVVFLDGDDRWAPTRMEALHWLAIHRSDLDILLTNLVEFGPRARYVPPMSDSFDVIDQRRAVLDHCTLYVPAVRRDLLVQVGGMVEDRDLHRDWELAARLVLAGGKAGVVAEPLYEYRRWDGQSTADVLATLSMDLRTLEVLAELDGVTNAERAELEQAGLAVRVLRWRSARELGDAHTTREAAEFVAGHAAYPWSLRLRARVSVLAPRLTHQLALLNRRLPRREQ